jgi:hypothetical protein
MWKKGFALFSLEPNLATTCKKWNRLMWDESVYRRFILLAFFDNDESRLPVNDSHFNPPLHQYLTHKERLRLQKQITKSHWFTLECYRQYIPTLLRLALERERELHRRAQPNGTCPNQSPLPARDDEEGLKTIFSVLQAPKSHPDSSP